MLHRLSTFIYSIGFCNGDSLPLSLENILSLQFSYSTEYGKYELAGRGTGINGLFLQHKLHSFGRQLFHLTEQYQTSACYFLF